MNCHVRNPENVLARKAVGDIKRKMEQINATTSTVNASVCSLDEGVLIALLKQRTLDRALQHYVKKSRINDNFPEPLPDSPNLISFVCLILDQVMIGF